MKIVICDDDRQASTKALALAKEYADAHTEISMSFSIFNHGEDLLDATQKLGGFDIYILDIVMPDINGIELGMELRSLGFDGKIIYLTSSAEFAVDSYRVRAFNYIMKPISKSDFLSVFDEAVTLIHKNHEKNILVKTHEKTVRIHTEKIMYAQLLRRAVVYSLTDGTEIESILIRTTFSEAVKDLLVEPCFVLCGKGTAVNLNHITAIENEQIVFNTNQTLYISPKSCRDLRSTWSDYWINKED